MFPKVKALPGAEGDPSTADGNGEIYRGQGSADVSGHIVVTFGCVNEQSIPIRHETGEEMLKVPAHVRVGIFLN